MAKKLLLTALTIALPGCAWTVRAPSDVADPVPVWITEYGRHCRVALPSGPSQFTEYGFGEWHFYALEDRGIISTLRAATGFGRGAFSRRELTPAPDGSLGPRQTGGTRSERVLVERTRADSLHRELDARWQGNQANVRVRGLDGVPVSLDAEEYHLFTTPTMPRSAGSAASAARCAASPSWPTSRSKLETATDRRRFRKTICGGGTCLRLRSRSRRPLFSILFYPR